MTFCLMSHTVLLNPPIILLMDSPEEFLQMALRVPLERAKPGKERGIGEEEALRFSPHRQNTRPPSFSSIGHALPPALLLHTPNKHSSAHVQARNHSSVSPAVTGAQGPQCIWAEPVGVEVGDQCCQTSKS